MILIYESDIIDIIIISNIKEVKARR